MKIEMRKLIFLILLIAGVASQSTAQNKLNLGVGYFGENGINPGALIEFEYEKFFTEDFSLPLRADFGYHVNSDFHAFTFDIHKGFRKYYKSGLMIEQSIGFGIIAKRFMSDYFFMDKYAAVSVHGNKVNIGLMPSITSGIGYDFSSEKDHSAFLWIRPKVYLDLSYRALNLPYAALQIGFTKTLKTK